MAFRIDELTFGDSSMKEQQRTRKVFLSLVKSANAGEKLTEHEKEFLYTGLSLSQADDGSPDQFIQCDNPKFKWLYLVYMHDLEGGSVFVKPSVGKGQDSSGKMRRVPIPEAQMELKYLIEKAEEFDLLTTKNSSDQLLQETIVEVKRELKDLNNQPQYVSDPYFSGRFFYLYPRWKLLLGYKYIFHLCQEIFETQNNQPYVFKINDQPIEINENSLVHIIGRHFFQTIRNFSTGKSYHKKEAFMPRLLGPDLESIFHTVFQSHKLKRIDKVIFIYNGILHALWTSERSKFPKGKGEIKYRRLDSLYPLEDSAELQKLQTGYNIVKINDQISVYEKI